MLNKLQWLLLLKYFHCDESQYAINKGVSKYIYLITIKKIVVKSGLSTYGLLYMYGVMSKEEHLSLNVLKS